MTENSHHIVNELGVFSTRSRRKGIVEQTARAWEGARRETGIGEVGNGRGGGEWKGTGMGEQGVEVIQFE